MRKANRLAALLLALALLCVTAVEIGKRLSGAAGDNGNTEPTPVSDKIRPVLDGGGRVMGAVLIHAPLKDAFRPLKHGLIIMAVSLVGALVIGSLLDLRSPRLRSLKRAKTASTTEE